MEKCKSKKQRSKEPPKRRSSLFRLNEEKLMLADGNENARLSEHYDQYKIKLKKEIDDWKQIEKIIDLTKRIKSDENSGLSQDEMQDIKEKYRMTTVPIEDFIAQSHVFRENVIFCKSLLDSIKEQQLFKYSLEEQTLKDKIIDIIESYTLE